MNTTTRTIVLGLALLAASVRAQPTSPALERAIVLDELEHDLQAASEAYAVVADDPATHADVRQHAWLRLGQTQQRLGDLAAARTALERAAAAGGPLAERAQALLQDPNRDQARNRAIQERAQTLGVRWMNESDGQALRDLEWMGRAAVPVLVRQVRENWTTTPKCRELVRLVWAAGGNEAARFIASVRTGDDASLRELIARYVGAARGPEMIAEAEALLQDPDEEVVNYALRANDVVTRYRITAILGVLERDEVPLRIATYDQLLTYWNSLRHEPDEFTTTDALTRYLARDLAAVDPALSRAATLLLLRIALLSKPTRDLLIARFESLGGSTPLHYHEAPAHEFEGDADGADAIGALIASVGPLQVGAIPGRLQRLIHACMAHWAHAALPTVLAAVRSGYTGWGQWMNEHAIEADARQIVTALAGTEAMPDALNWLSGLRHPPADVVPALLDELEPPADPSADRSTEANLYTTLGKTGHPDVPSVLLARLEEDPAADHYERVGRALLWFSERSSTDAARDALRKFVATDVDSSTSRSSVSGQAGGNPQPRRNRPGPDRDDRVRRNQALARLVQLGDPEAPALIAGTASKSRRIQTSPAYPLPSRSTRESKAGYDWLVVRSWTEDGSRFWHGYDASTYAAIWADLLGKDTYPWMIVHRALGHAAGQTYNQRKIALAYDASPELIEVVASAWLERLAREEDSADAEEIESLGYLLDMRRRGEVDGASTRSILDRLQAASHRSKIDNVRRLALDLLPAELDATDREAVLTALADPAEPVAKQARMWVMGAAIPVDVPLLRTALRSASAAARVQTLTNLAPFVQEGATEVATECLDDPSPEVRIAACNFLSTRMDLDSVAPLLGSLRDVTPDVREAAAAALTAIRFYYDQEAHWERMFSGRTGVTKNAAAEALVAQIGADQPRETRLLAIRSLGQLGAVETLPFLIDLTKSDDSEIAAAARAAIGQIHGAGGK